MARATTYSEPSCSSLNLDDERSCSSSTNMKQILLTLWHQFVSLSVLQSRNTVYEPSINCTYPSFLTHSIMTVLIHFFPMSSYDFPRKIRKPQRFLIFESKGNNGKKVTLSLTEIFIVISGKPFQHDTGVFNALNAKVTFIEKPLN